MKIELTPSEYAQITGEYIVLKVNVKNLIQEYTERLNGSKTPSDASWYSGIIKIQRERLMKINNILNKLK